MRVMRTRTFVARMAVLPLIVAMFAGCQTVPSIGSTSQAKAPLTPEEQAMRDQSDAMSTTVIEGAVFGAVAGAVLGALLGGNSQGAMFGALAGSVAGGAGGYAVGSQQQQYAATEAEYDKQIAALREDNQRIQDYTTTVRSVVAANLADIDRYNKLYASAEVASEESRQKLATIRETRENLSGMIAKMKEKKDAYLAQAQQRESTSGSPNAEMEREIQTLTVQIVELEQELDKLDAALTVSKVG